MANFIVSYDLNGSRPTHKQMDDHLKVLPPSFVVGRLLESVWYIGGPANAASLRNYVRLITSPNDQVLVVEASKAAWSNLLATDLSFKNAFEAQPATI